DLGEGCRSRARSRLSDVRPARSAGAENRKPRTVHATVPEAHRGERPGLARAPRAVAPSPLRRPAARRAGSGVRCARPESARARHPPGDLASPRPAASPDRAGRSLLRADPARGLLPRSARLYALPLPQHRAAVAVPALPRLEHVRRRTDRAGAGPDRSGSLKDEVRSLKSAATEPQMKVFLSWSGKLSRDIASRCTTRSRM